MRAWMQTSRSPPAVVYLCDLFFFFFLIVPALVQSLSQLCWHLITSLSVPQKRSQIYTRQYLHTASIFFKLLFWQSDRQGGNAITELVFAPWLRGAASVHMWGMCACDKFHVSSAHLWSRNSCRRGKKKTPDSLWNLTSDNKRKNMGFSFFFFNAVCVVRWFTTFPEWKPLFQLNKIQMEDTILAIEDTFRRHSQTLVLKSEYADYGVNIPRSWSEPRSDRNKATGHVWAKQNQIVPGC